MTIGYIGLRYIELSISSPICNSSGALVAVLALATGGLGDLVPAQLVATALVCVGVIGLGIVEAREDDDLRAARQEASNHRYAKSVLALALPVVYCLLDALGTFADSRVLETLNEDSANCAYELTFLLAGIVCFIYVVLIKRVSSSPSGRVPSTWAPSAKQPVSSPTSTRWRIRPMWRWPHPSSPPTAWPPCCGAACSSRRS